MEGLKIWKAPEDAGRSEDPEDVGRRRKIPEDPGRSEDLEGTGRCRKIGRSGRSRKMSVDTGRSREIPEDLGRSRKIPEDMVIWKAPEDAGRPEDQEDVGRHRKIPEILTICYVLFDYLLCSDIYFERAINHKRSRYYCLIASESRQPACVHRIALTKLDNTKTARYVTVKNAIRPENV